jgi:hypothetical protein
MTKCVVVECSKGRSIARGSDWCDGHWELNRRYGTPTPVRECTDCSTQFKYINSLLNGKSKCIECFAATKLLPASISPTLSDHGITAREYIKLYDLHDGACKLCSYKPIREGRYTRYALEIDHDHSCCGSGRKRKCGNCIRGLLCQDCNIMIGRYEKCKGKLVIPVFDAYIEQAARIKV